MIFKTLEGWAEFLPLRVFLGFFCKISTPATSTNAAEERGLSKAEQATYKSSLGNLATLMRASRDSLNANNNNNQSVRNSSKFQQQPQTQPPSAPEAEQSPSFQVINYLQIIKYSGLSNKHRVWNQRRWRILSKNNKLNNKSVIKVEG